MRHRICKDNGLGTSEKVKLDNKGKKPPLELAVNIIDLYFQKELGCDFSWTKDSLSLGVEPAYQGQDLKILTIHRNKDESSITTGHAFGYYGTGIRSKTNFYKDYKNKSKFVKLVNKWHPILFPEVK